MQVCASFPFESSGRPLASCFITGHTAQCPYVSQKNDRKVEAVEENYMTWNGRTGDHVICHVASSWSSRSTRCALCAKHH